MSDKKGTYILNLAKPPTIFEKGKFFDIYLHASVWFRSKHSINNYYYLFIYWESNLYF